MKKRKEKETRENVFAVDFYRGRRAGAVYFTLLILPFLIEQPQENYIRLFLILSTNEIHSNRKKWQPFFLFCLNKDAFICNFLLGVDPESSPGRRRHSLDTCHVLNHYCPKSPNYIFIKDFKGWLVA